jgi:hypothetical protein
MKARRLGVLAAAAGVLLSVVPLAVRAEPAEITLAGLTTVDAATSSSVIVQVPKDVPYTFTADGPGFMSLSGEGRAIAAALQPAGSREISEAVVMAQFNGCDTPGCARAPEQSTWVYVREARGARRAPDGRPILAAGAYRLSVMTDGRPVQVRLRVEGLDGTATGNTSEPAESGITPAATALAVPGSPVVWSGSADMTFASENSLLLAYLQQDSPLGAVAGAAGACHFTGATRPLLGVPAPGCPFEPNGADGEARVGSVATETLTLGAPSQARFATALSPTVGAQQVGLWSTRIGITDTPLAFFAWLRLT